MCRLTPLSQAEAPHRGLASPGSSLAAVSRLDKAWSPSKAEAQSPQDITM